MIERVYSYFTGKSHRAVNDAELVTAVICGLMLGIPVGFILKVFLDTLTFYEYSP
jgi:hypothetical protein